MTKEQHMPLRGRKKSAIAWRKPEFFRKPLKGLLATTRDSGVHVALIFQAKRLFNFKFL